MTELLKNIVMSASGIIVFGSVCEMILPDNTYKKYVHLAIGLMLILAFLSPFINRNCRFDFEIPTSAAAVRLFRNGRKNTRRSDSDIHPKAQRANKQNNIGCNRNKSDRTVQHRGQR